MKISDHPFEKTFTFRVAHPNFQNCHFKMRPATWLCFEMGAVCGELALRGHRWEPGTLIFMFLSFLHNYHILMFPFFSMSFLTFGASLNAVTGLHISCPVPAAVSEQLFEAVDCVRSIWQRPWPMLAFQVDIAWPVITSDSVRWKWEIIFAVTWHHVVEWVREQRSGAFDRE